MGNTRSRPRVLIQGLGKLVVQGGQEGSSGGKGEERDTHVTEKKSRSRSKTQKSKDRSKTRRSKTRKSTREKPQDKCNEEEGKGGEIVSERSWWSTGESCRHKRERVLSKSNPNVGYFAHADPGIQFLADFEGSIGTPSLCEGEDFDFDDVHEDDSD